MAVGVGVARTTQVPVMSSCHCLDWFLVDGAHLALAGATLPVRVMNLCYGD